MKEEGRGRGMNRIDSTVRRLFYFHAYMYASMYRKGREGRDTYVAQTKKNMGWKRNVVSG